MPAMSGSSSPIPGFALALRSLASNRRASLSFRFSSLAISLLRFRKVGFVFFGIS
jgi:hypothetical protein